MRVISLVPAATEIVAALGGADQLVGISHECDYPSAVWRLPRVTSTPINSALPGAAIDVEVRQLTDAGQPVFAVDLDALQRLAPDLLLTQGVCEVCAVSDGMVHRLAAAMHPAPAVHSLEARDLAGIWRDIRGIGAAIDLADEAEELVAGLKSRLHRLRAHARTHAPARPRRRVLCIEWLDPLYLAGHWVPELVEAAGGRDVGAEPGTHSARWHWHEVRDRSPDLVLVMLCGFGVERSRREIVALDNAEARELFHRTPTWILDGNAYTSRSGPRVVDGAERIQAALSERAMSGLARWRE